MKRKTRFQGSGGLIAILVGAGLLIAGSIALASQDSQQPTVAAWSDIEVQKVNVVRISRTALQVDMTYVGKSQKQDAYPFFFHVTDESGILVAQIDVSVNSVPIGKVSSSQYEVRLPPSAIGKIRIVMGRYNSANTSRIATINGLPEVEIGVIDVK
ncbi:MAG TPA: hypothetical protein VJG32_00640 [Anaerolineae bacterium]|nr:hypothetical protein [Anaerolineae bacterium]